MCDDWNKLRQFMHSTHVYKVVAKKDPGAIWNVDARVILGLGAHSSHSNWQLVLRHLSGCFSCAIKFHAELIFRLISSDNNSFGLPSVITINEYHQVQWYWPLTDA
jgi:hypothetical protein